MNVKAGDTFLLDYPDNSKKHLFIVVTKVEDDGTIVCAMVSSVKPNSKLVDEACILEAGEHPFIKHKSYVAYQRTLKLALPMYSQMLEYGQCIPREPASPELLKKIRAGAALSTRIMDCYKKYYLS